MRGHNFLDLSCFYESFIKQTNYGRPKWDLIFSKISIDSAGKEIGVFTCGPKPVTNQVMRLCEGQCKNTQRLLQKSLKIIKKSFVFGKTFGKVHVKSLPHNTTCFYTKEDHTQKSTDNTRFLFHKENF